MSYGHASLTVGFFWLLGSASIRFGIRFICDSFGRVPDVAMLRLYRDLVGK